MNEALLLTLLKYELALYYELLCNLRQTIQIIIEICMQMNVRKSFKIIQFILDSQLIILSKWHSDCMRYETRY